MVVRYQTLLALVTPSLFADALPSRPTRIMPLGDSITYGAEPCASGGGAREGYRGPLWRKLRPDSAREQTATRSLGLRTRHSHSSTAVEGLASNGHEGPRFRL